ncbi:Trm112p-like protein [Neorhodopirellula lusitana]|uniref:Trm112p-like protein n=1 Tax=Neorhodopirellula lusitana TaxID=445327 RepID=A0ABY1Q4W5_9BACT|nr:Trm112 family protein [Neorhodopirellula lusitana]SMP58397.1 Trm112p-like protein [Neorhodopirellula lusitana]
MTITPDILPILRCPAGGEGLTLATDEILQRVNQSIEQGLARDQVDARVDQPIEAGLVNRQGDRLYPIRDGIATLIIEDAIRLDP